MKTACGSRTAHPPRTAIRPPQRAAGGPDMS